MIFDHFYSMKPTAFFLLIVPFLFACNKDLEREKHSFKGSFYVLDKGVKSPKSNFELRLVQTEVDKDYHTDELETEEGVGSVIDIQRTSSSGYYQFQKQDLRIQNGLFTYKENYYIGSVSKFTDDVYSVYYLFDNSGEHPISLKQVELLDGGKIQGLNIIDRSYFDSEILQVKMGELNFQYTYSTSPSPNDTLIIESFDPIGNHYVETAKVYANIQSNPIQNIQYFPTSDNLHLRIIRSQNGIRTVSDEFISLDYSEYKTVDIGFYN